MGLPNTRPIGETTGMTERPAFFVRDGKDYRPTVMARSPWSSEAINGAAIGGLLAQLIDEAIADSGKHVVRLTVDILGEVPRTGIEPSTRILRDGRRIAIVEAELSADRRVGARATALCVAPHETMEVIEPNPFPRFDELEPGDFFMPGFFQGAPDIRPVRGRALEPGPGTTWLKYNVDLIAGEPMPPLARAAIVADFGVGVGSVLPRRDWTFPNLDIGINFIRMPVGEWVMIDSTTETAGNGHAVARSTFADEEGIYARGQQILFVDKVKSR
jgi:acyl-coenzyme A thioesterase PaaI-like protein